MENIQTRNGWFQSTLQPGHERFLQQLAISRLKLSDKRRDLSTQRSRLAHCTFVYVFPLRQVEEETPPNSTDSFVCAMKHNGGSQKLRNKYETEDQLAEATNTQFVNGKWVRPPEAKRSPPLGDNARYLVRFWALKMIFSLFK